MKPQDFTRLAQDKEKESVEICVNLWLKNRIRFLI